MRKSELAAKHAAQAVTEQLIDDLRQAMSRCWDAISCDIEDYDETLALYKKRGETYAKHSNIWEARCIAEMTIDAGRLEMYGFNRGEPVPDWWKALYARNGREWNIINFATEVWLAS